MDVAFKYIVVVVAYLDLKCTLKLIFLQQLVNGFFFLVVHKLASCWVDGTYILAMLIHLGHAHASYISFSAHASYPIISPFVSSVVKFLFRCVSMDI